MDDGPRTSCRADCGLACVGGHFGLNSRRELERHSQEGRGDDPTDGEVAPTWLRTITVMSVTINLSSDEVAQIKRFTQLDIESEAVAKAAREFLRVVQLRELKAATGKVDYQGVGEEMEALELREQHPHQ